MSDDTGAAQPILVPVDLSPHSEAALLFASDLAERFEAPLVVLHVAHDPASGPDYYEGARRDPVEPLERVAAAAFDEWVGGVTERHPEAAALAGARRRLVAGVPAGRILEVATGERARMIVMGSQGRTGLPRVLLGSNAMRVAQLAQVPVTIVKAPGETDA